MPEIEIRSSPRSSAARASAARSIARFAGLFAVLAVLAVLVAAPASAYGAPDEDPGREPLVFSSVRGSAGAAWLRPLEDLNQELNTAGYEGVSSLGLLLGLRFLAQVEGFSLAVTPEWMLTVGQSFGPPYRKVYGFSLFGEVGYDALSSSRFALVPTIGVGSVGATVCLYAESPEAKPAGKGSGFSQVFANPGRESCFEASALGLRVSLLIGIKYWSGGSGIRGGPLITGFRPFFGIAVAPSRWTVEGTSLPGLVGPRIPYLGAGMSFEFGFGVGAGTRQW